MAGLMPACASRSGSAARRTSITWGAPLSPSGVANPGQPEPSRQSPPGGSAAAQRSPQAAKIPAPLQRAADELVLSLQNNQTAWDRMAYMCDHFGPRPLGSKGLRDATAWAVKTMKLDGLSEVRAETVMLKPWIRGQESAQLTFPIERELHILGLGLSVKTPRKGIEANVEVVETLDQISSLGMQGKLQGKIVLVNGVMPPFDHAHNEPHYGSTVRYRSQSASLAAKHGAKAVLVRSITARSLQNPHTGSVGYDPKLPKIPAAALTLEDTELLVRLRARGEVKVRLKMQAQVAAKEVKSANVIAELPGSDKGKEIVLIGAHIDSWDRGPGAQDDAGGVLMVMEAMRLLKSLNLRPKRTIRAVLFTDEESGLRGARAYMEAHGKERHIAAIEADMGAGAPRKLGLGASESVRARLAPYLSLFRPLGIRAFGATGGGADISFLMEQGVLGISVEPDLAGYFDIHHSEADTPEKIDPQHLQANAAAMALMAYLLASEDLGLTASTPPSSPAPPAP